MTQSNSQTISNGAVAAETLLEARVCSKTYEAEGKLPQGVSPHLVQDNVQLSIHCGEFVALLGPSGSEKSTLLRILAGPAVEGAGVFQRAAVVRSESACRHRISIVCVVSLADSAPKR